MSEELQEGVEINGPFKPEWRVTVNGFALPHISVSKRTAGGPDDGVIDLTLDGRMGHSCSEEEFKRWAWFLGNCMAVAAGYSCFGENSVKNPNPYQVRVGRLDLPP